MEARLLLRAGFDHSLLDSGGVTVALSGGADSTALLLALAELAETLGLSLSAAHLNHGLRGGESDRDEAFCIKLCGELGIPFYSETLPVADLRAGGESIETAARRLRYDFFCRAAARFGADRVATAHSANDQAETLLLRLARGTGGEGLGGIPPARPLSGGLTVIRPLLAATRTEIEAFLRERGQTWVTDSTNLADDADRNLARHTLVPGLERLNPRFVRHAADAAESLRQDNLLLETLAAPLAEQRSAAALAAAPLPLAVRALRRLCAPVVPDRVQTEALLALCCGDDPSGSVSLPGGLVARREYDRLIIGPVVTEEAPPPLMLREGTWHWGEWTVTLTRGIDPPPEALAIGLQFSPPYLLRSRQTGDSLTLPGRPRKTLKKLFIEAKIPARRRDFIPVVVASGRAAAVPGFGVDLAFAAAPGTPGWQLTFQTEKER